MRAPSQISIIYDVLGGTCKGVEKAD